MRERLSTYLMLARRRFAGGASGLLWNEDTAQGGWELVVNIHSPLGSSLSFWRSTCDLRKNRGVLLNSARGFARPNQMCAGVVTFLLPYASNESAANLGV